MSLNLVYIFFISGGLEHSAVLVRVKQRREVFSEFRKLVNNFFSMLPEGSRVVCGLSLSSHWVFQEQSVDKPLALVDCTKLKTSTSCLVLFSRLESTFLPRCFFALSHCCGGVPNASWSRFRSFYKI